MYTVYILYSYKDKNLYVGQTHDINERLKRHNAGHVIATKLRRPLELLYSETYTSRSEAVTREKYYKSLWSSRFKKQLKEDFERKINMNG
jgi:putative endonuclease